VSPASTIFRRCFFLCSLYGGEGRAGTACSARRCNIDGGADSTDISIMTRHRGFIFEPAGSLFADSLSAAAHRHWHRLTR
jgi:hypothetical protein